VLSDADDVAGLAGGTDVLLELCRVDDSVVAVAGERGPKDVDTDLGKERAAGGASV
jgi:hypothetical protein